MHNRFLIGAAAAAMISTSAFAADLPSRRLAPAPPPIPVFTWTGIYFGGNAGYAFDARTSFDVRNGTGAGQGVGSVRPPFAQTNDSGFAGGLDIGYNFELGDRFNLGGGGLVFGVEADADYTDLRQTTDVTTSQNNFFADRTRFIGTARGRLGYAFDRAFVYGTGGFAYGDVSARETFFNGPMALYTGGMSKIETGYVFGGGVEYALPSVPTYLGFFNSSAVTVRAEFLHYELGKSTLLANSGAGTYVTRIRTEGDIVRAGLNFKLGGAVAPVVARY